jgi:PAS domain S-box-containing protein
MGNSRIINSSFIGQDGGILDVKPYHSQGLAKLPALVSAALAIAMLVLTPFWAMRWYRLPFLGALFETNNVVSSVNIKGWPATEEGVKYLDRLVALNGETLTGVREFERIMAANGYKPIQVSLMRWNGEAYDVEITPIKFPLGDIVSLFIVPYLMGLAFLGIGLWAYRLRSDLWESRALLYFVSGATIMMTTLFEISTTRYTNVLWGLSILLSAGGLMYLALVFPQPTRMVRANPRLRWLPWGVLAILAPMMVIVVVAPPSPYAYTDWWQYGYLCIVVGFLALVGMLTWRIFMSKSNIVRQQSRVIIFGTILALLPIMIYLALLGMGQATEFRAWVFFPPMIIMPLSITYAILRFRLLDVDRILSRLLAYLLTMALALGTFYGLIALFSLLLQDVMHATDPLVIGGYLLLLAVGLMPVRNLIQRAIDRLFYRSPADYRRALTSLSRGLVITPDLSQTLRLMDEQLNQALSPEKFVIYLYNDDLGEYFPHASREDSAPPYQVEDPLVHLLQKSKSPIWLPPSGELPKELEVIPGNYRRLKGYTFVPLHYEEKLIGFLMLGPRRSGDLYTSDDLDFLAAVAAQSTLALENARLFANLRRTLDQTLEMKNLMSDIFASISTGVITTDLDRKVTLFNHAAEKILGLEAWQVMGRRLSRTVPGLGVDLDDATANTLNEGAVILGTELMRQVPSRGDVVLRLSCAPLRDAHLGTKGATLVIDDLTERRKLEAEQERIRQTFGRVVAPRVRDRLLADPGNLRLDGTRQVVTVLFADLSGFTAFSEKHVPETVFKTLNTYLSMAAQTILEEEGTLDKFMGDAVLAIWNSPDPQEDHALRAVRAALTTMQRLENCYKNFPDAEQQMGFRIGITTGPAMVGNVGTNDLFNYTAIGDAVNLAQRLQAAANPGQILLYKDTYDIVAGQVVATPLKPLIVKGRAQPADVYELKGLKG